MRSLPIALAGSALLIASPLAAQEGVDWGGLMAGIAHGTAMDEVAQESVSSNRRSATRATPAPSAKLTYTPSIERRRANFARFVEKSRAKDSEGAALLEKELATVDLIDKMAPILAEYGMRIDNVGHAYATWWLNAWLAAHRRTDTPPAAQIVAIRDQAVRAMASLPEITTADDAAKQEMAETYLLQAALIGAHLEHAKDDPTALDRIATAVREGARSSGLDLDAMALTDSGFVPGQAAPTATTAAEVQKGAGSNTLLYVVGAAAIAGLLGGIWFGRRRRSGARRPG